MTGVDVEALKAAAEKADEVCDDWYSAGELQSCGLGTYSSDFIALANPAAVLALITALEDAQRERDEADETANCRYEEIVATRKRALAADAERDGLQRQLDEAVEELQDMVGYVPDYFREKWGYDETIARLAAAAAAAPVEGQETHE